MTLRLEGKARRKALAKIQRLQEEGPAFSADHSADAPTASSADAPIPDTPASDPGSSPDAGAASPVFDVAPAERATPHRAAYV